MPSVREGTSVLDAVREITKKHIGMTAIVDNEDRVTGIFTDSGKNVEKPTSGR